MHVHSLVVGAVFLLGAAVPTQDGPRDQERKNSYVVELKLLEIELNGNTHVYTHPPSYYARARTCPRGDRSGAACAAPRGILENLTEMKALEFAVGLNPLLLRFET